MTRLDDIVHRPNGHPLVRHPIVNSGSEVDPDTESNASQGTALLLELGQRDSVVVY